MADRASRPVRLALAAALLLSAGALAVALSPLSRAMSMGNSNNCYWHLYGDLPDEVRVVAIGSSRIRRSVMLADLEAALSLPPGGAANLAHANTALRFDVGLVEEMLARERIDLLLFEVWPHGPALRRAMLDVYDPRAPRAEIGLAGRTHLYIQGVRPDVQLRHAAQDAETAAHASQDAVALMRDRVAATLPLLMSPRRMRDTLLPWDEIRAPAERECFVARWDDPSERAQDGRKPQRDAKARFAARFAEGHWTDPDPLGYLTSEEMAPERALVRRVAALAEESGTRLIFLYVPAIHVPVSEALPAAFEAEFGAPLLVPDARMRARLARDGYVDATHLNTRGRSIFGPWLAEAVSRALPDGLGRVGG